MKAKPRPGFVGFLAAVAVVLVVALPSLAYQYPLSSTDVRNAYLTGTRKDWVTNDFLSQYRQALAAPATGPHVAEISIDTPYSQVVRLGQAAQNQDSQQAVQDFTKQTFQFIVRVEVDETAEEPTGQDTLIRGVRTNQPPVFFLRSRNLTGGFLRRRTGVRRGAGQDRIDFSRLASEQVERNVLIQLADARRIAARAEMKIAENPGMAASLDGHARRFGVEVF